MCEIDPSRVDLAEEFKNNPGGPYSPELTQLPPVRGDKVELLTDQVFGDYYDAVWEVFKRRWKTLTGQDLAI
jgi:hypothetical protein